MCRNQRKIKNNTTGKHNNTTGKHNNSLPNNLLVYFKKVYDCHQHNTRKNNDNFKIRFSRTTMKATSLCMKAPKMWNELCNSVKLCSSVQEFKHKYKIFLLKNKNY